MLDFTSLAAVTFGGPSRHFVRVFYQDGCLIKESCYDSENGWYTMPDDIVANNARVNSPIAATNWKSGTQTRVYYLNEDGKLRQRCRVTAEPGEEGNWLDASDFPSSITPATYSKLTAIRSNDAGANIRLYYQATDNTVKQLRFESAHSKWLKEKDIEIRDAKPGTHLSAVTGGDEIRVFYQNNGNKIKMQYTDTRVEWTRGKVADFEVAGLAPLTAVSWDYGNNFKIKLFSVLPNCTVAQFYFEQGQGGWDEDEVGTQQTVLTNLGEISAVFAIRSPTDGSIFVFHQPERRVIGLYMTGVEKRIPLGIPTSGLTQAERQREVDIKKKRQEAAALLLRQEEQKKQEKLQNMGLCPAGYTWVKEAGGYRCSAGGHFVSDSQLANS